VLVLIGLLALLTALLGGWRIGLFALLGLLLVENIGLWQPFVQTLALVITAQLLIVAVGLPLGVLAASSESFERALRPVLDFMQTMPAFVYLIPAVMFFGIGLVPGVVATFVFALPPLVRLVNLGIRQVPADLVEAADAFGSTAWQKLVKVEIPVARPSIMAGLNQSIMLNLSMVVIAGMIGARGLGAEVLRGIQRLNVGQGFEAGLAVVILAIVLDRVTAAFGKKRPN
jgi:ABC-type proline/glycine betaine transport system permease subunit